MRGLLTLLEHPINMAHLAKLFTAQLIISCNFDVNFLEYFFLFVNLRRLFVDTDLRQYVHKQAESTPKYMKNSYDDVLIFLLFFALPHTHIQNENELQMALPNIDLSKLSKLRQRLVAPSLFSTQYLFPGNQAFFRDFIICSDFHMMFMEQLKIALISELLQMNDSSMETLSIARGKSNNNDDDDDNKEKSFQQQEFIVST